MFPFTYPYFPNYGSLSYSLPPSFHEALFYYNSQFNSQKELLLNLKNSVDSKDLLKMDQDQSPSTEVLGYTPEPFRKRAKVVVIVDKKQKKKVSNGRRQNIKKTMENGVQKQGRNANSNLLRMFFRRLTLRLEAQHEIIEKIIKSFNFTLTTSDFANWLECNKIDYRNYIRIPSVKKLFVGTTSTKQHAKILRILLKEFINKESICCYLTSRKIKKQAMVFNYHALRSIFNEITNDFVEQ